MGTMGNLEHVARADYITLLWSHAGFTGFMCHVDTMAVMHPMVGQALYEQIVISIYRFFCQFMYYFFRKSNLRQIQLEGKKAHTLCIKPLQQCIQF